MILSRAPSIRWRNKAAGASAIGALRTISCSGHPSPLFYARLRRGQPDLFCSRPPLTIFCFIRFICFSLFASSRSLLFPLISAMLLSFADSAARSRIPPSLDAAAGFVFNNCYVITYQKRRAACSANLTRPPDKPAC
ncbi:MAG TPA: hypothetical protein DGH25_03790 [Erwiniaceae bacterium]|nr:hypothetical protein [Erwiniaceae bacterium]